LIDIVLDSSMHALIYENQINIKKHYLIVGLIYKYVCLLLKTKELFIYKRKKLRQPFINLNKRKIQYFLFYLIMLIFNTFQLVYTLSVK